MLTLAVLAFTTSCDEDVTDFNPPGDARYRLTFQGNWNQDSHGALPGNAHFTTLIGMTHKSDGQWFSPGGMASAGVEEVAETGKTDLADSEIQAFLDAGSAFSKPVIEIPFGPETMAAGEFTAVEGRPYLTAISMIAPSPDWFMGVRDFRLYSGGAWVSDTTFAVAMYDAGTEDGDVFSLDNPDTTPQGTIEMLTPLIASVLANGQKEIVPVGTIRLQRIE